MTSGIFIIQNNDQLIELDEKEYDSELVLQKLLTKHPGLLAGKQIDSNSPRRWLLITREMTIPFEEGGREWMSLDHLFLDQDAIPTLVEVKRSSDTRIRREVVGQMLDYAANAVVYWPLETIRARFYANCDTHDREPGKVMKEFLEDDITPDEFWEQAKNNLNAGKIRMLFVADEIPTELQRIVEFLNEQMNPAEVLAVEIKQYTGHDLRTLVPRVIGQTASTKPSSSGQKWDPSSFFAELERRNGETVLTVAQKILAWAKANTSWVWWGEGRRSGSFFPMYDHGETSHTLFAVWTYGKIAVQFQRHQHNSPFDDEAKRIELLSKLNTIEGIMIPEDGIDRRPSFELTALKEDHKLEKFFRIFEWFIDEVEKAEL
ncbi:MAG: hypothetical protein U9Q82_09210 [Chloroflexota bacterium]|nr:hypothetical protein [Chloroflexota bacterium]